MLKAGDVVLAKVQFTDTFEVKTMPALVLYEELDNVVVAGITSNPNMKGIPISTKEGAVKDSVIKLNYIFTISRAMASEILFSLSQEKRGMVLKELLNRLNALKGQPG